MMFMKFTPTVTVLEGDFKKSQKSPPGAAGGGDHSCSGGYGQKSRVQTVPNMENSEFHEKLTPRVMENVILQISLTKIHFGMGNAHVAKSL